MKHKSIISSAALFFFLIAYLFISGCGTRRESSGELKGTISISGAFALYPMTVKWAEEFRKEYPDIRIDISAGGAGKGMTDVLSGMVDLAMFSRDISQPEIDNGAFGIAVAKDAVLPTISAMNPYLSEIKKKGFTRQMLIDLFIHAKYKYWGEILGNKSMNKVNIFTRSDACGAGEMWGKYLGHDQETLKGIGVFGDPGMADAVKQDKFSIGYNNTIFAYDIHTLGKYQGLEIIPLDLNENGKIDPEENFYDSLPAIMEAIRMDVYPSPPARPLYFISKGKPVNKLVLVFLEWVLTKGQEFVHEAGYVNLPEEFEKAELEKLKN